MDKKIDSLAQAFIRKSRTAGLCIGIIDDGVVTTCGYGETGKGSGKIPDADSIFEIGSITKTFTAAMLARYVIEGKISLDDPVTKYLPVELAVNPGLEKIKILHLANHTSGLPRLPLNFFFRITKINNPYKGYDRKMLFSALKRCRVKSISGEVYAYSNLGAGLLGVILERVSGKAFEQLVKEIITGPLKMRSTVQYLNNTLADRVVKFYNRLGNRATPWDFDALAGCGCLKSSVNDLVLYAKANLANGNDAFSKVFKFTHQVTYSKTPRQGLGWHLLTFNGDDYYWHNGGTGGCHSFFVFNSPQRKTVIVLSNSAVSCDALAIDILKTL